MNTRLPAVNKELVPGLDSGQVHGTEGASTPDTWNKARELFLELVETFHHDLAWSTGQVKQIFFLDGFYNLSKIIFYWFNYLVQKITLIYIPMSFK